MKRAKHAVILASASASVVLGFCVQSPALADVLTLNPTKDNTLCESSTGAFSNALGDYFFAGRTGQEPGLSIRRALVMFDLASIPADATINSATLSLRLSRSTQAETETISLHRLLASWGEGTSNAPGQEGEGAPATPGDATWLHRFYNTTFWSTPGGDFAATSSAATAVGTSMVFYSWSSAQLTADVQGWLADPASNNGWIVIGNESSASTAKRFDSRNISDASRRPKLVVDFTAVAAWMNDGDSVWSLGTNWSTGTAPNGIGAAAKLGPSITQPRTVTLDVPVTLGSLTFDSANRYTVAGAPLLTFDTTTGDAMLKVASGSHTISAPVSLADNTVIDVTPLASTLTLSGEFSGAVGITATKTGQGNLEIKRIRADGLTINTGKVRALPDGSNGATNVLRALTIAGGSTPTATFDIADNALVVDYTVDSPLATIKSQITSAYNGGSWDGPGITSSMANASTHGVGYAQSDAIFTNFPANFGGEQVDDTAVLVRYTRWGDADLNGIVNLNDFNRLAANFGTTGGTWSGGDFDYNGIVNLNDFNKLAANFGLSASPDGPTPQDWAALAAAVPEPGTALLLGIGLLARRRRN